MTVTPSLGRSPAERRKAETAARLLDEGWGTSPSWKDVWREHAAPEMVGYFNGRPEPNAGIEAFLAFQEGLFRGLPDITNTITAVTVEGDTVVVQCDLDGIQSGPFLGVPPSNRRVRVPDVTVFRFREDKIAEIRYFTDLLAVMTAIGATESVSQADASAHETRQETNPRRSPQKEDS